MIFLIILLIYVAGVCAAYVDVHKHSKAWVAQMKKDAGDEPSAIVFFTVAGGWVSFFTRRLKRTLDRVFKLKD